MAKRFTDTEKWGKAWFRKLSPKLKCLWQYLCDSSDIAGIWDVDLETASHFIGEKVSMQDIESFGDRSSLIKDDKLFLKGFIEFQYDKLSEACRPHQAVIRLLEKNGIDPKTLTLCIPFGKGSDRDKDKDKNKDKDKDKEEGGVGETKSPAPSDAQKKCEAIWLATLKHFNCPRPILSHEKMQISTAIKSYGLEAVELSLEGMCYEKAREGFNPAQFVNIKRAFDPNQIGTFINLAARRRKEVADRKNIQTQIQLPPEPRQESFMSAENIKAYTAGIFKALNPPIEV